MSQKYKERGAGATINLVNNGPQQSRQQCVTTMYHVTCQTGGSHNGPSVGGGRRRHCLALEINPLRGQLSKLVSVFEHRVRQRQSVALVSRVPVACVG
ncbi:hypothetical protein J6590_030371 [Homalodisca vitripennis]|nr:hypothetical protein J6590_030371 [Homalodisca vitripennis]